MSSDTPGGVTRSAITYAAPHATNKLRRPRHIYPGICIYPDRQESWRLTLHLTVNGDLGLRLVGGKLTLSNGERLLTS